MYENLKGRYQSGCVTLFNDDCMKLLAATPDNYYHLCIVDPPYGIGMSGGNVGYKGLNNLERKEWDKEIPPDIFFDELRRVSVNQIVWGGQLLQDAVASAGLHCVG